MKIKNKTSCQIIDVPSEHGTMLLTQGWVEYNEPQQERTVIHEVKNEEVPQANRQEEVLIRRGRPKKSNA